MIDEDEAVARFWQRPGGFDDRWLLWAAVVELLVVMPALILGWIPTG